MFSITLKSYSYLIQVNNEVASMQDENVAAAMVPFPTYSLRKKWYFNPPVSTT